MNKTLMGSSAIGMLLGAIIAFSLLQLGFWKTVIIVIAMVLGALTVRVLEGRLDLRALFDVVRGRRSS